MHRQANDSNGYNNNKNHYQMQENESMRQASRSIKLGADCVWMFDFIFRKQTIKHIHLII